jgi:hypothetical protein
MAIGARVVHRSFFLTLRTRVSSAAQGRRANAIYIGSKGGIFLRAVLALATDFKTIKDMQCNGEQTPDAFHVLVFSGLYFQRRLWRGGLYNACPYCFLFIVYCLILFLLFADGMIVGSASSNAWPK